MEVNIAEAKTDFSKLVRLVENGSEDVIWICRYNKPVAKLTKASSAPTANRIGIAKGKLQSPKDLDMDNDQIEEMFGGSL